MNRLFLLLLFALLVSIPACIDDSSDEPVTDYTYRIVNSYPHDPQAFTQGLIFEDGFLYESTGLYGQSSIRRVDLQTGEVLQSRPIPKEFFGEGIAVSGDRLIQLTWGGQTGFVYDKQSFDPLGEFAYPTKGWGITSNKLHLIMSDGTDVLRFWDPVTFQQIRQIQVHDESNPVVRLNELEYIGDQIYANVWQTDMIVIIDPETGGITGRIDLTGLLAPEDYGTHRIDVLNGIAYDAKDDRLFVTGKLWPKLFEIELVPAEL